MTTEETIALTRWTFVGKVMSLIFNMLSKKSQNLLIPSLSLESYIFQLMILSASHEISVAAAHFPCDLRNYVLGLLFVPE